MNIFIVSKDPDEAAKMLCDLHIQKMYIESAQVLSGALWNARVSGIAFDATSWNDCWNTPARKSVIRAYKPTHLNHPCTRWAMRKVNYMWLLRHAIALCDEFEFRFGSQPITRRIIDQLPRYEVLSEPSEFALCMHDDYKIDDDPVASYRCFYHGDKKDFAKWERGRAMPDWYKL